jgi:phosphatidylinositol alpha-1,6-mannosyltransferase
VIAEVFPPAIGGSGALMSEVYRRFVSPVTVLTDGSRAATTLGSMTICREPMAARHWGLLHPAGGWHHLRRAARVRRMSAGGRVIVHCSAVLPEGLDAALARATGGAPFLCWAHGEELATADRSRELRMLARRVISRASRVIANSRNTTRWLARFGVPADAVHVVYPGVDTGRFAPDASAAARRASLVRSDEVLLLTVSRLQARKGHDLVLRALARLAAKGIPVRYVVVGDGRERPALEQLAASLGVADRVRFTGAVSHEDLPSYYAAADLFVLPNRVDDGDFEGFGMAFLEAAAAGLPTIGGASGGVPEAIVDGETGFLVSGSDVDELAERIERLAVDADLRARLGRAGRARVERDFNWDRAARDVEGLHDLVALESNRGANR